MVVLVSRITRVFVGVALCLCVLVSGSGAWVPPAGTPLDAGVHPRIFFIAESYKAENPGAFGYTVSEFYKKISQNPALAGRLQELVDEIDNAYSDGLSSLPPLDVTYRAINFAFLYLVDPGKLADYGVNTAYSRGEYGSRAVQYAKHVADKLSGFTEKPTKLSWLDYISYDYGNNEWYGVSSLSIAVVNDWVHELLTLDDRKHFVDAVYNAHVFRYPDRLEPFASAKQYGAAQNGTAGVLGLYGDDVYTDGGVVYKNKIDELMAAVNDYWLGGLRDLHELVYGGGTGAMQGDMYNRIAMRNVMIMVLELSTCLNTNFIEDISWIRDWPLYWVYFANPRLNGDKGFWIMSGDVGPKNGTMNRDWGKHLLEFNPIIDSLTSKYAVNASVHKWMRDESRYMSGGVSDRLMYRTLLYELLFSGDSVVPKSPGEVGMPLSHDVGNGRYVFRTGFDDEDDTVVTFAAPKFHANDGGHSHRDFASFQIFKYGDLTTRRSIAKDFAGGGEKLLTRNNYWYNTIGVLDRGEVNSDGYNVMGYRSGYDYYDISPDATAYSDDGRNVVGVVVAEDIGNGKYDYVDYVYSRAWDGDKVKYSEREIVYIRSSGGVNDEYVVVYDRVESVQPEYKKYWLLQSPYEPTLVDSSGAEIAMVAEDYPSDPDGGGGRFVKHLLTPDMKATIRMDNTYSDNGSHGRLFSRPLWPSEFQVNKVNGPGHYWEDAEGKMMATRELTEKEKNYHGSYIVQIESGTDGEYDVFLNVLQFGDIDTLGSMVETERVVGEGSNGNLLGGLIAGADSNKVVLFNAEASTNVEYLNPPIRYSVSTNAGSVHMITNVSPEKVWKVTRDGQILTYARSNDSGMVSFEDGLPGSAVEYLLEDGSGEDVYPPTSVDASKR